MTQYEKWITGFREWTSSKGINLKGAPVAVIRFQDLYPRAKGILEKHGLLKEFLDGLEKCRGDELKSWREGTARTHTVTRLKSEVAWINDFDEWASSRGGKPDTDGWQILYGRAREILDKHGLRNFRMALRNMRSTC